MKVTTREKNFLFAAAGALLIAAIYRWGVTPILANQAILRDELATKRLVLEKSKAKIARKGRLEANSKAIAEEINRLEKRLLLEETPSLAAAELQKLLKKIFKQAKVKVSSEKIVSPQEIGGYQRIPVEVTLKCLVTNLKNVLYEIEHNPIILQVPELKIKVGNLRTPSTVEATLTISGIIKKKNTQATTKEPKKKEAVKKKRAG